MTQTRIPGGQPPDRSGRDEPPVVAVLGLAWLAAANSRAPLLAIGPLLPLIIADLGISATVAGALTGLPVLIMGLISFPGGLLSDRVGPRRMLAAAQLSIAIFSGLRGLAEHSLVLLAASVAMGAAIGMSQPALAQVARGVSRRRVGLATAVYANGLMLGAWLGVTISAPLLLPLAGPASWRGVLLFWAAGGLLAALGWALMSSFGRSAPAGHSMAQPETSHASPIPHPVPPITRQVGQARAAPPTGARIPLHWRQVFGIPGLLPLAVAFASQGAIFYALATWLPQMYVARGWSLAEASLPLAVLAGVAIPVGAVAPLIAAHWGGPRGTILAGALLTLLGQVGLLLAPEAALVWAVLIGVGTALAFTLTLAGPAELAPPEQVGAAAGLLLAVGHLGSMLGPLGFGALFDLSHTFAPGLVFLVVLAMVLTLAAIAIPRRE